MGGIENHNNNGSVPPFFSLLSVCSLGVGRRLVADLCEYESGMGQVFFLLLFFLTLSWNWNGTGMFLWKWNWTGVKIQSSVTL